MSVVYFIQAGAAGRVKIGWATNLSKRIAALQTGCPSPLIVLATIAGGQSAEARLHRALAAFRVRGEWFDPSPEVLAAAEAAKLGHIPAVEATGTIAALVERLGGLRAFATLVGVPLTTAASWRDANRVPHYRQSAIVAAIARAGLPISTADFPTKIAA